MTSNNRSFQRRVRSVRLMEQAQLRQMRVKERGIPMQRSPSPSDITERALNAELHKHLVLVKSENASIFWLKPNPETTRVMLTADTVDMITKHFRRCVGTWWEVTYLHDVTCWRFEQI